MSKVAHRSDLPTQALSYDPTEGRYWDPRLLDEEVTRVFGICHGCRMCFKFCDSFPTLFSLIDDRHNGDVRRVTPHETEQVMDACFQCKLCEVQCPYTPRDEHSFQLDFPRLVHRHQAVRARNHGIRLRDRLLGAPDLAGKLARASFGLADRFNRWRPFRVLLEALLGIHRDKELPPFAPRTFESWTVEQGRKQEPGGEAVLFPTCYVQNNEPRIGRDVLFVLDRNGVDCRCPGGLGCCGMPAWEHGDLEGLRAKARANLDVLLPHVEQGAVVLAINPTCSMMMRREYPELLEGADRERARVLAEAIRDPGEYLWSIRNEDRFDTDFRSTPGGPVAYHAPCHLRAQAVGFKGRDLLRKIPGVQPQTVMECCGHDGTYAMKVEGFEPSARVGRKAFEGMGSGEASVWSTDCPLAAIQFRQHAGKAAEHPLVLLARAYRSPGEGGFEHEVPAGAPVSEETP